MLTTVSKPLLTTVHNGLFKINKYRHPGVLVFVWQKIHVAPQFKSRLVSMCCCSFSLFVCLLNYRHYFDNKNVVKQSTVAANHLLFVTCLALTKARVAESPCPQFKICLVSNTKCTALIASLLIIKLQALFCSQELI